MLREAIDQVAFAAASDDTRPVLAGVLMRLQGSRATFAAADGFRLAHARIDLPEPVAEPQELIVPARADRSCSRIIGDSEGSVELTVTPGGSQVLFHTDNIELVSRLIDGKYPDIERRDPEQPPDAHGARHGGAGQGGQAGLVLRQRLGQHRRIAVEPGGDFGPGKLMISANAAEVGDNNGEVDGMIAGEAGQIALNVKFLAEAIGAIKTPQVALETQTQQNPAVFKPVGAEGYVHIVMPMTVR